MSHKLTLVMQVRYFCSCAIPRFGSLGPQHALQYINTVAQTYHFMYPSAPIFMSTSIDAAVTAAAKAGSRGSR